jgi:hypothetical protein
MISKFIYDTIQSKLTAYNTKMCIKVTHLKNKYDFQMDVNT